MPRGKHPLGPVSSGTHNYFDLTDRFWATLHELDPAGAEKFAKARPYFFSHDPGTVIEIEDGDDDFGPDQVVQRLVKDRAGFLFMPSPDGTPDRIVLTTEWEGPDRDDPWWQTDLAHEMINEHFPNALQNFAGPYCTFGAHPGDGAEFGFWFDQECLDTAIADECALKIPGPRNWTVKQLGYHSDDVSYEVQVDWPDKLEDLIPEGWKAVKDPTGHTIGIKIVMSDHLEHIVEVNERGNVTIFNLEGQEVLAVV